VFPNLGVATVDIGSEKLKKIGEKSFVEETIVLADCWNSSE
jgi:hypothetical protein